ncbi:MAG: hypothetical protein ACWGSQ_12235 [Longimicrobiales bacterium]
MRSSRLFFAFLCLLPVACSTPFGFLDEDAKMTLAGVVTAAASGAPLQGVYVSLEWTPETSQGPGTGPIQHVDTKTASDGAYRVQVKLSDVNCSTLFLRVSSLGYKAVLIHPDCKSGKQIFDVALPAS